VEVDPLDNLLVASAELREVAEHVPTPRDVHLPPERGRGREREGERVKTPVGLG
jgi:hypothetical protein